MKKLEIQEIQMECNSVLGSRRFMSLKKADVNFCGVNELAKDIGISEEQADGFSRYWGSER